MKIGNIDYTINSNYLRNWSWIQKFRHVSDLRLSGQTRITDFIATLEKKRFFQWAKVSTHTLTTVSLIWTWLQTTYKIHRGRKQLLQPNIYSTLNSLFVACAHFFEKVSTKIANYRRYIVRYWALFNGVSKVIQDAYPWLVCFCFT